MTLRSRRKEVFCAVVKNEEESDGSVGDVCGSGDDVVNDVEKDGGVLLDERMEDEEGSETGDGKGTCRK